MMKKRITLSFLLLLTTTLIFGQSKTQKLDTLLTSLYKEGAFNGNMLIAEKGKVIFQKSFGFANETTKQKLNGQSVFELASVSKQFTAMAIVLLKEKGKLSYEDKISKYLPGLTTYDPVTIRNLLQHTGGLPDYMEWMDSLWDKTKIATNRDVISLFEKYRPAVHFEPNTQFEYSNTGYAFLASIIEQVSGQTYASFLAENIFKPLGMHHSFVYSRRLQPRNIDNYALGYVQDSLGRPVLPDSLSETRFVVFLDGIVGDGCVNATVGDLLLWDRALTSHKLVQPEAMKEIFSPAVLKNKEHTTYGFGWFLDSSKIYGRKVSHSGSWPGYLSYIERGLSNDKTIIILQNHINDKTVLPIRQINQILYNIPLPSFITLDSTTLYRYAGDYKDEKSGVKKIVFEQGKLYIPMNEEVKLELRPIAPTKFLVIGFSPDVYYDFIVKDGKVEQYIVTQPEQNITESARKIKTGE